MDEGTELTQACKKEIHMGFKKNNQKLNSSVEFEYATYFKLF